VLDQGGGTGGVIERENSLDSFDREIESIDKSYSLGEG
jgi:hypothetical protein